MKVSDMAIVFIAGFLILVSFLNPGGLYLAVAVVGIIVFFRLVAPWLGDYYVSAHSGKVGRQKANDARQSGDNAGDQGGGR